jgi:hypothetical protein
MDMHHRQKSQIAGLPKLNQRSDRRADQPAPGGRYQLHSCPDMLCLQDHNMRINKLFSEKNLLKLTGIIKS